MLIQEEAKKAFKEEVKKLKKRKKIIEEFDSWITFIKNLNFEKKNISFYILSWFQPELHVSVEQTTVEESIENILGPLHREFNLDWRLVIEGDEKEPVFKFKKAGLYFSSDPITISVKEGAFKQCSVVKEVVGYTESQKPEPKYKLKLICE